MQNPYLPPDVHCGPTDAEAGSSPDRLVFSDSSNHRNTKMHLVFMGGVLPLFSLLTMIGFSRGATVWSIAMGGLVVISSYGWFRALNWFVRPFEFYVEFNSEYLRIWDTRRDGTNRVHRREDIQRILIERPAVTFGTKASRLEKGFPGIYWTDERIDRLERFLSHHWPEVRIDRL